MHAIAALNVAIAAEKKPAAWLVAGGILSAIVVCGSCLAILIR